MPTLIRPKAAASPNGCWTFSTGERHPDELNQTARRTSCTLAELPLAEVYSYCPHNEAILSCR